MTRQDFVKRLKNNFDKAIALVEIKNKDYAEESNPFKNFEFSQLIGLNVPRAILMRILDKMARVSNLLDKDAAVKDESVEDTIIDMINYLDILLVYLQSQKEEMKKNQEL